MKRVGTEALLRMLREAREDADIRGAQVAACMAAALGNRNLPRRGDRGWSPALEEVAKLRTKFEKRQGIE